MSKIVFLAFFIIAILANLAQGQPRKGQGVYEQIGIVRAHATSHSGNSLAFSNKYKIMFWDLKENRFNDSIDLPVVHLPNFYGVCTAMVYSPDDTALFFFMTTSYDFVGYSHTDRVHIGDKRDVYSIFSLDLKNRKLTTVDSDMHICTNAFSHDGTRYATLSNSGVLSLNEIESNKSFGADSLPAPHDWQHVYTIYFSQDDSKIIVNWFGQLFTYDANKIGQRQLIADTLNWAVPKVVGNTVFITRHPQGKNYALIDIRSGKLTKFQPLPRQIPEESKPAIPISGAVISDGEYMIARYEITTTGMYVDGGPRIGVDSIIIFPRKHPDETWGIAIDPAMEILEVIPNDGPSLLIHERNVMLMLNLKTREVKYLGKREKR